MRLNWKVSLFSLVFIVVFVRLGVWQWQRAEEKVGLLAQYDQRRDEAPRALADVPASGDVEGMRVRVVGEYGDEIFLLDNVVLDGRVGFEVLMPFRNETATVMVDRGFVPIGRTRSELPEIPALAEARTAVARLHMARESGESAEAGIEQWDGATILLAFNPGAVSKVLGEPVYGHLLRLDKEDPNALPRYWPVTVMSPERHRGYAFQWWLMAIAVVIAWGVFTFRRDREHENGESGDET